MAAPEWGWAASLRGGGSGCVQGWAEEWCRWLARPSVVLKAGGTHRALLLPALPTFCQVVFCFFFLLPALQKWQLSFSVSLYLSVRNLSPVHVPAATFVLYSFFAGEEVCPSAPQQRPGPRASRLQTPSKFRHLDLGQLACFITMEQWKLTAIVHQLQARHLVQTWLGQEITPGCHVRGEGAHRGGTASCLWPTVAAPWWVWRRIPPNPIHMSAQQARTWGNRWQEWGTGCGARRAPPLWPWWGEWTIPLQDADTGLHGTTGSFFF